MADIIALTASELARFLAPLRIALDSDVEFEIFLRRFGLGRDDSQLGGVLNDLGPMREEIGQLIDVAGNIADTEFDLQAIRATFEAARPVFDGIDALPNVVTTIADGFPQGAGIEPVSQSVQALPLELFDLLLADYLERHFPLGLHILSLLDVYRPTNIPETGEPRSRGLPYIRYLFDWSRIEQLFTDPSGWARAAYDWGVDFDSDNFIGKLARIVEFIGGIADIDEMSEAEVATFMPGWPTPNLPPLMARAPIFRKRIADDSGDLDLAASGEAGFALFPVAGKAAATRTTDRGLGLGPYLTNDAVLEADLGSGFSAEASGGFDAVGGVVVTVRPSGLEGEVGVDAVAFSGSFAIDAFYRHQEGDQPITLIGDPDGTRLETNQVFLSVGGEVANNQFDMFVAGGLRGLKAVIDPGDDGLLSAVVSAPLEIETDDIVLGWRFDQGLYFESGSSLSVDIPVDIELGPVNIYTFGVALDWGSPSSLTVTLTGDLRLGPLYAYAEGIGITTSLVDDPRGNLGHHDLRFGFQPPNGYAIALEADPIEGGGLLSIGMDEYRGALALKFQTIGFSAFGILDTTLPDGEDGFSFVASIFGEFNLPLGFGFFLTGVGGVVGMNRTIDTDALRDVLYEGRLDNILFPDDPIANAATILDDMAAIMPPRAGQHLFGPVARIGWGQPVLIDVTLGVVIEVGRQARLLVLGGLASSMPTKDTAIVSLNISFFGEIDFAARTITFDASLVNSRVLTFPLSGDSAIRTGWAPRLEHLAAFGGMHPKAQKPANLPDLRRLSINFGSNNPKLTLSAYLAATSNSLQAGARADLYAKGPKVWLVGRLAAEGWVYFDALIYFNPFSFDVTLGGGINLLVDGDVVTGLGFELRLRGPNTYRINGRVWVTVFGIDVGFGINYSWGSAQTIPTATVDAARFLRDALQSSPGFEAISPTDRTAGVAFAKTPEAKAAIDPIGGLSFIQRAVPLGVAIDKIGQAQISSTANRVDLKLFDRDGREVPTVSEESDFVRGHFFDTSEAERLRATAFERLRAGIRIANADLVGPVDRAIVEDYSYEIIEIPAESDDDGRLTILAELFPAAAFAARATSLHLDLIARPTIDRLPELMVEEPIVLNSVGYVAGAVAEGAALAIADDFATNPGAVRDGLIAHDVVADALILAQADNVQAVAASSDRRVETNSVVADYIVASQF